MPSALSPEHQTRLEPSVRTSFRLAYAALFSDVTHGTGFGAVGAAPSNPVAELGDVIIAFLIPRGLPFLAGSRPLIRPSR